MTEVVYNSDYGGFGLSDEAKALGREISKDPNWAEDVYSLERTDPTLVEVVNKLGRRGCYACASLEIRDITKGSEYRIDEYDGFERVMLKDEYDWSIA